MQCQQHKTSQECYEVYQCLQIKGLRPEKVFRALFYFHCSNLFAFLKCQGCHLPYASKQKLGCFHVFCLFFHFTQTHHINKDCGYHTGMFFHVCLFQTAMLFLLRGFLGTPVSDKDDLGSLPLSSLSHLCQYISYQNGVPK